MARITESLAKIAQHRGADIGNVCEMLPPMSNVSDRGEEILQPIFAICFVLAPKPLKALQESPLAMDFFAANSQNYSATDSQRSGM